MARSSRSVDELSRYSGGDRLAVLNKAAVAFRTEARPGLSLDHQLSTSCRVKQVPALRLESSRASEPCRKNRQSIRTGDSPFLRSASMVAWPPIPIFRLQPSPELRL